MTRVTSSKPVPGQPCAALGLPGAVLDLIQECMDALEDDEAPPLVAAVTMDGKEFDCVVHIHQGRILVEFLRDPLHSINMAGMVLEKTAESGAAAKPPKVVAGSGKP